MKEKIVCEPSFWFCSPKNLSYNFPETSNSFSIIARFVSSSRQEENGKLFIFHLFQLSIEHEQFEILSLRIIKVCSKHSFQREWNALRFQLDPFSRRVCARLLDETFNVLLIN